MDNTVKVIKMSGGIGNQMAGYATYVAAKHANPNSQFYFDTYMYDIKEIYDKATYWNGYELSKVFGVEVADFREQFSDDDVQNQIKYLSDSKFWNAPNGNYGNTYMAMMKLYGVEFENSTAGAYEKIHSSVYDKAKQKIGRYVYCAAQNRFQYMVKRAAYKYVADKSGDVGSYLLLPQEGNYFYDINLDFMKSRYLDGVIGNQVKQGLQFKVTEEDDLRIIEQIQSVESVSIHVRRSDYLGYNEDCYKFGYFIKAVNYIKKHVSNPVFYIFSDEIEWCKNNLQIIGLSGKDEVVFSEMNRGSDSWKDMMLMSKCKHNITTKSSFGWWASYLNENPNKITICQLSSYLSTVKF